MTQEQIRQNAADYVYNFQPTGVITEDRLKCYIAGANSLNEEIGKLKGRIERLRAILTVSDLNKEVLRNELDKLRNPWISVEERLPEEGQAVIVRLAYGAGNHAACNYSNGQFVWALGIETSNVNIQSRLKLPAITHWMPIPELKKGE